MSIGPGTRIDPWRLKTANSPSVVVDARAEVEVLDRVQQDEDHPVLMGFPESGYREGLFLRRR